MPEVAAVRTVTSPEDLREFLIGGHIAAAGEPPNYARLGVGWAQLMLESGRGQSVWNHNFGNLKCASDACQRDRMWCRIPPAPEEYPFQRAYVGPVEGAAAYWRLIASRYPQALPEFDAGKPYEAMYALWNGGNYPSYFEAAPEGYARTVSALFTEYVAKFPKHTHDPGGKTPTAATEGTSTVFVLAGLGVALGAALYFWT